MASRSRLSTGRLVLIGLMGAGKSTVAARVGGRLGWDVSDLDALIERDRGASVGAIFADEGEPAFRLHEVRLLSHALASASEGAIVALGGGAYMTPEVRALCAEAGALVVYLHAAPDALARRLTPEEAAVRPLLGGDVEGRLYALYAARDATYRRADAVIETGGRSIDEVVEEVVAHVG